LALGIAQDRALELAPRLEPLARHDANDRLAVLGAGGSGIVDRVLDLSLDVVAPAVLLDVVKDAVPT